MESGLEDRNNQPIPTITIHPRNNVSMESGLEDRNNPEHKSEADGPEQVSMESGLEDRNNHPRHHVGA